MGKFTIERTTGQKHLMISRPPRQNVADMLENVYSILGNQLQMLKNRANIDELDGKDAAKLHKMVLTLQILSAEEAKHTAQYALETYSDEDLKKLTDKISKQTNDLED